MRFLTACFCLLVMVLTLSCSDDSNPVIPHTTTTFQLTLDIGMSDLFYGVTEGPGGTITACGKSSWMVPDPNDPPNQITEHFAQMINFTPEGDTNWVERLSYSGGYMEFNGVTQLDEGGYLAVGELAPFDYSWSYLATAATDNAGNISWSDTEVNSTWAHGIGLFSIGSGQYLLYGVANAPAVNAGLTLDSYSGAGSHPWDTTIIAPDTSLEACSGKSLGDGRVAVLSSYFQYGLAGSGGYFTLFGEDGSDIVRKAIPVAASSRALDFLVEEGKVTRMFGTSFADGIMSIVLTDLDSTLSPVHWQATPLNAPVNIMKGRFTSDGGVIIVGMVAATSRKFGSPAIGPQSGTLIKFDSDGVLEWQTLVSLADASVELNDVIEYSEGGYVAVGLRQPFDTSQTQTDYLIIKTDASGNIAATEE